MRWLGLAVLAATSGCSDIMADHDGHVFGEDLGEFHVVADMKETSCGIGAADSPERWEFDIRLSHDGPELFWNTGAAAVQGHIENDGVSFALASQTVVEVSEAGPEGPGCTMVRDDRASGIFDTPHTVQRFTGTLSYAFSDAGGSTCSDLVGVPGGFATLPCEMTYAMTGTLARSPSEIAEASR